MAGSDQLARDATAMKPVAPVTKYFAIDASRAGNVVTRVR